MRLIGGWWCLRLMAHVFFSFCGCTYSQLELLLLRHHRSRPRTLRRLCFPPTSDRLPPAMSSCTGRPEADTWVAQWIQSNQVIGALMQLPLSERQSIVRNVRHAHANGQIRAGIDAYVMGCVRRYSNQSSPYRPPGVEVVMLPGPAARPLGGSPGVRLASGSPSVRSNSAGASERSRSVPSSQCESEREAANLLAQFDETLEFHSRPDLSPPLPDWVRAAFAAHPNRGQVVQHFAGSLGPEATAALRSLHPQWQHCIAAAAMLSARAWGDMDAIVLGQVNVHQRLQSGAQSAAASAAPAPPSTKLVVVSIGVGLGVVPLATQAAARAIETKYGAVLQVMEIHELSPDSLSGGIVQEVSSSFNFDIYQYHGTTNVVERLRGSPYQSSSILGRIGFGVFFQGLFFAICFVHVPGYQGFAKSPTRVL